MKVKPFNILSALVIAALLIPTGFLPALADQKPAQVAKDKMEAQPGHRAKAMRSPRGDQARLAHLLGPEAAAQVQAARKTIFKDTAKLRQEIRLGRAEMRVLMLKETTTQNQLLAKHDQVASKTSQLREILLLHRLEMLRQFPELSLLGPKKGHRKAFHRGAKHRKNRFGHGQAMGQAGFSRKDMKAERLRFFKANLDLRKQIQLARAQLKVLILDPAAAKKDVVEKYRHLAGLTSKLNRARLIHRWQIKQQSTQTAQALPRLPDREADLAGAV